MRQQTIALTAALALLFSAASSIAFAQEAQDDQTRQDNGQTAQAESDRQDRVQRFGGMWWFQRDDGRWLYWQDGEWKRFDPEILGHRPPQRAYGPTRYAPPRRRAYRGSRYGTFYRPYYRYEYPRSNYWYYGYDPRTGRYNRGAATGGMIGSEIGGQLGGPAGAAIGGAIGAEAGDQ